LGRAEYKAEGGKLIRVQLSKRGSEIEIVKITGDFFLHPEELIDDLEKALEGHTLSESHLTEVITALMEERGATLLGASPRDLARCIMRAGEKDA
jgi:hypothetical protein